MFLPECFLFKKERKRAWFGFFLSVLFHVSVFAFITVLHVTIADCLLTRLLISLVLYSMFRLPRLLFLFVATLHLAA